MYLEAVYIKVLHPFGISTTLVTLLCRIYTAETVLHIIMALIAWNYMGEKSLQFADIYDDIYETL